MLKKNIILAVARVLLSFCMRFLLTPLALGWLGVGEYGLWMSISAALALSGVVSEALAGSAQRQITASLAADDVSVSRASFTVGVGLFAMMSLAVVVLGLVLKSSLLGSIDIPAGREHASSLLYNLSLLGMVMGLLATPYQGALVGSHRQDLLTITQLTPNLLLLAAVFLLKQTSMDALFTFGILSVFAAVLSSGMCMAIAYRLIPATRLVAVPDIQREAMKYLDFALWNLVARLNWMLRNSGTVVVLSAHFGNAIAAGFSVANSLVMGALQLSFAFSGVVQAEMTAAEVRGDRNRVARVAFRISLMQSLLGLGMLYTVVYHGEQLLAFWLKNPPPYSAHFLILAVIYQIAPLMNIGEGMIMEAKGRIRGIALAVALPQLAAFALGVYLTRAWNAGAFMLPHLFVGATLLTGLVIRPVYLSTQGVLIPGKWLRQTVLPLAGLALACALWSLALRSISSLPPFALLVADLTGWSAGCLYLLRLTMPETLVVPQRLRPFLPAAWRKNLR